jgi:xylulokinase
MTRTRKKKRKTFSSNNGDRNPGLIFMLLMGIDVGTTGAKAAVFDELGVQKGYGFEEYGVNCPEPGRAEQDPEEVWRITKRVIAKAASESGPDIGAISVSVQGDAVIPIDGNRAALAPAQLGMDYRGTVEAARCGELFGGKELFRKTGIRPHPINSIVKVLWIKNNEPDLFEKTRKFGTYGDFILGKLGSDEAVIDHTMASRSMAMDLASCSWSEEILGPLGIPAEKLGRIAAPAVRVGKLPSFLAGELGIKAGAAIVTGGHDQTCAAMGAGIVKEGMALDSHGTAEVVSTAFVRPRLDDLMYESYYPCYLHAAKDLYFTFSLNHTAGILLKWFVEGFCGEDAVEAEKTGKRLYELALQKDDDSRPSPVMVFPSFNGSGTPTCVTSAKGAILGLTLSTTRHDIARAINEALSFELKINLDTFKKAGIDISLIRCVGGGARSPIGLQSKADITGLSFAVLQVREAACLGAAMLAGISEGVYSGPSETAGLVHIAGVYEPEKAKADLYEPRFNIYRKYYNMILDIRL